MPVHASCVLVTLLVNYCPSGRSWLACSSRIILLLIVARARRKSFLTFGGFDTMEAFHPGLGWTKPPSMVSNRTTSHG